MANKKKKNLTRIHFDPSLGDQPMATGYIGAILVLVGPILLTSLFSLKDFVEIRRVAAGWILLVGLLLVGVDAWVRKDRLKVLNRTVQQFGPVFKQAFWRWLGWLSILLVLFLAYRSTYHYRTDWYRNFFIFFQWFFWLWFVLGIPYYLFVLRRRYGFRWDRKDLSVYFWIALRRMKRMKSLRGLTLFWARPSTKTVLLGLLVKAFFLPLMMTFYVSNFRDYVGHIQGFSSLTHLSVWQAQFYPTFTKFFLLGFSAIFMLDVVFATVGYVVSSRLVNNAVQSVESTALGWMVCIACYRPINDLTGWYFRWPGRHMSTLDDSPWKVALMLTLLVLMGIYVWATLAFGVSFSNLTHRGIFTRGPYRWVRHPAYAAKSLAWWLEYLPSFVHWKTILAMLGWNVIYLLRAYTEERHLGRDPKYQMYREKVRWRFVPRLF